jgi:hypothetical protein
MRARTRILIDAEQRGNRFAYPKKPVVCVGIDGLAISRQRSDRAVRKRKKEVMRQACCCFIPRLGTPHRLCSEGAKDVSSGLNKYYPLLLLLHRSV